MTVAERKSAFKLKTNTPYLTLMGELWGAYGEDLGDSWLSYNSTAVYKKNDMCIHPHGMVVGCNQDNKYTVTNTTPL